MYPVEQLHVWKMANLACWTGISDLNEPHIRTRIPIPIKSNADFRDSEVIGKNEIPNSPLQLHAGGVSRWRSLLQS